MPVLSDDAQVRLCRYRRECYLVANEKVLARGRTGRQRYRSGVGYDAKMPRLHASQRKLVEE